MSFECVVFSVMKKIGRFNFNFLIVDGNNMVIL